MGDRLETLRAVGACMKNKRHGESTHWEVGRWENSIETEAGVPFGEG